MRILSITAQKPNSTGSGVYLTELVKEFAGAGHRQAVAAGIYSDETAEFPEGVEFTPVYFDTEELPFHVVGMSDEMPYPSTRYRDMTPEMVQQFKAAFLKKLIPLVEEFDPEIILCHHLYLLTAIVRKAFPERKICGFCHNTDLRQMQKTDLEREYIRSQIKKLDRIFVAQKAQQTLVAEMYGYPSEQIKRIGVGYNADIFRKEDLRKKDGITRIAYAGKIAEKKGVFSLIRSLDYLTLPAESLEITLVGGAGNKEEYAAIEAAALQSRYSIRFAGKLQQPDLAEIYNTSDIFVMPSFFDGSPLTVIEAFACGCRVVMTRLPGIPEWISDSVDNADIIYVDLPEIRNADEPVPETLPAFEKRLGEAIEASIRKGHTEKVNVSRASWAGLAEAVLSE